MAAEAPSLVTPVSLPRFIALQSTTGDDRYLTIDVLPNDRLPYLTFTAEQKTRLVAHQVVFNVDEEGVFMLRAPNARFWEVKPTKLIVADRESLPISRASAPGCYFKAFRDQSGNFFLRPASDGMFLTRNTSPNIVPNCLSVASSNPVDGSTYMRCSNAADVAVLLPRFVMLLGDNDRYIGNHRDGSGISLRFVKADPEYLFVSQQIHPLIDGNFAILNVEHKKFWRRIPDLILPDVDDLSAALSNKDCQYDVMKLSNTKIAFKSIANGLLLKRYTDHREHCLRAIGTTIDDFHSHLRLREPVLRREIYNVKYLLALAEVDVDATPLVAGSGTVINNGVTSTNIMVKVAITKQVSNTQKWTSSTTFNSSFPVGVTAAIPEVVSLDGSIAMGRECSFSTEMGCAISKDIAFDISYELREVPPGHEATVTVECHMAKCRIPFTYTSRDTRVDDVDQPAVEGNVDGIFESVNALNIRYVLGMDSRTVHENPVSSGAPKKHRFPKFLK